MLVFVTSIEGGLKVIRLRGVPPYLAWGWGPGDIWERGRFGAAIRDSGIAREEVFVTAKLWNDDQGYDSAMHAFDASLKRLGLR